MVISLHQDMVKRVLVGWLSDRKIYLSPWMELSPIWSSILIVFPPEWQLVTLFKHWLVRWLLWREDFVKTLPHSDHSTWRTKLNRSIDSVIKSTVMKWCSILTVVKSWRILFLLAQFTIKDLDIWSMIRCMQGREVLLLRLPDSLHMEGVVREVLDLVKWKEIALFLMVSAISSDKDFS